MERRQFGPTGPETLGPLFQALQRQGHGRLTVFLTVEPFWFGLGWKTQTFFTDHFELKGHKNVRVTVSYPNLRGWMAVECDLVQQANGEVQPLVIGMGKESGSDEDGPWTEGETTKSETVAAQPAGQYSLKLEVEREHPETSGPMTVKVDQGAATGMNWLLALVARIAS